MIIFNYDRTIKKGLYGVLLGFIVYLLLYKLFNQSTSPLTSLIVSAISGLIGVLISTLWLFRIRRSFALLIILAYMSRIIVGIILYVGINDTNYFSGNGMYKHTSYEFSNNYFNAVAASTLIKQKHTLLPSEVIPDFEIYKDRNIQTWMGFYLAIGSSKNAMDLAVFNSFHHILAGIFIILLGFVLKFDVSNSIRAGTITSWIPWAFPSSLLWRDSIGLAFICFAIFLIFYGNNAKWKMWQLLCYIFAFFLASSVRSAYGLLILMIIAISLYLKYSQVSKLGWKSTIFFLLILLIILFTINYIENFFFFSYLETSTYKNSLQRFISFPLLILRALAGPFPWQYSFENSYVFFDYFYHVLQFSIILLFLKYNRFSLNILNPVFLTFILFWSFGIMAIGVHTAYLAVSLPFLILINPIKITKLIKYFTITLIVFVIISFLYSISGLHGQGLIIKSTNY